MLPRFLIDVLGRHIESTRPVTGSCSQHQKGGHCGTAISIAVTSNLPLPAPGSSKTFASTISDIRALPFSSTTGDIWRS